MAIGRTTNGNDLIRGSAIAERLEGANGNDTILGGGGADTLVGDNGNDRLITRDGRGTTGLRGGAGDDFLSATMRKNGQVHLFGMEGNDTLEIDLTKDGNLFRNGEQINYMGHHAYGGTGADTFAFINPGAARGVIIGRIDDFDPNEDRLMLNNQTLDLNRLPNSVKLFEFKEQQWLKIGSNAYYALEGARDGGAERHFLDEPDLKAMITASRGDEVGFINQNNEVPTNLFAAFKNTLREITFSGANQRDFDGTAQSELVNDTRVRGASDATSIGNNTFEGGPGRDVINAGKGDDTLRGGLANDSLAGGQDDDVMFGDAGNDHLYGGSEDDRLSGGSGNDVLEGGTGNDNLKGNNGNDVLRGKQGRDNISGGNGDDRMSGGDNGDRLMGDAGNDRIYGEAGRDFLRGGSGRDALWGGTGADRLDGGSWSDRLAGQDGNDVLIGGQGNDTLRGGNGNDWISGGRGRDRAFGEGGADEFVFHPRHLEDWDRLTGTGSQKLLKLDRIEDFEIGVDQITFSGFGGTKRMADISGGDLTVEGQRYVLVTINESNHRLLVHLEDDLGWQALRASADSFEFV